MTPGLRILLLDNSSSVTGAFRSAVAMAKILETHGKWQFVLTSAPALHRELAEKNIASHVLPMVELGRSIRRLVLYLPMLAINGFRLRGLLRRSDVQTLIANDYYNLLPAVVRLLGWRGRTVTIVRLLPCNQQPFLNRLWITAIQFASDAVVAVSRAVQEQLPSACNARLVYFPVGYGLEEYPYVGRPRVTDVVRFLYLANYIPGKGQEFALKAFADVAAESSGVRLTFVGGDMGLAKNAAYRTELMNYAEEMGLGPMVEFQDSTDDVASVIRAADVVLNFSESESFSHTCVEAALLGRPVIATRCGGPEEIIEDGVTGILVGQRNLVDMVAAMKQLAASSNERQSMGRVAVERARLRFGTAQFAAQFLSILFPSSRGRNW